MGKKSNVKSVEQHVESGAPVAEQAPVHEDPADASNIPPDSQNEERTDAIEDVADVSAWSTDDLMASYARIDEMICAMEKSLADALKSMAPVEAELCKRVLGAAKEAKREAVVIIGGKRLKVKNRAAKHGGGLHFVDAKVSDPIGL